MRLSLPQPTIELPKSVPVKAKSDVQLLSTTVSTTTSHSTLSELYSDASTTKKSPPPKITLFQEKRANGFNLRDVQNSVKSIFVKGSKLFGRHKTKVTPISGISQFSNQTAASKGTQNFQIPSSNVTNFRKVSPSLLYSKNPGIQLPQYGSNPSDQEDSPSSTTTTDSEPSPTTKKKALK